MSSPTDPANEEFEAGLRQLLKAEADTVVHSPEALNLIRERTAAHRGGAWFGLPWLRPALAVAGAVLIAASVVMSTPQVREQVLEMVPAGADRNGTPTEQDGGGVAAPTLEEEVPEPEPQTSAPEPSEEPSAEPSEPAEGEAGGDGPTATTTCPSNSPSASSDDKKDDTGDEDCKPSEEPTPGGGGTEEPGTGGGGGEDPGGSTGGGSGGDTGGGDSGGSGSGSTGGEGTEQQSSTANSTSAE